MNKIVLGALVVGVLGAGALAVTLGRSDGETPELRLRAVLMESDTDVTDKVTWFVERDNAWLGPDFETVSAAVPGVYTAEFQVLGGAPVTVETTIGEGESGEVLAQLDASLVEIKLEEAAREVPVALDFESTNAGGSEGLRVTPDGYVRALVSPDIRTLQLKLPDRSIPVTGNFASGTINTFEMTGDTVAPIN